MESQLNIGLIDTPLSTIAESSQIERWPGAPLPDSRQHLSHADINMGLLLGHDSVEETPILPESNVYVAEAVQETNLALRLLEALEWMANQPVKVVAMPFGEHYGSPFMIPMIQLLLEKDILPVAAIGNKGAGQFSAPGCYSNVLSVGAIDNNGKVPAYSGSFNNSDGTCIKPEVLTSGSVKTANKLVQGTSFAATRLAASLAIYRDNNPNVACQQLINHTCWSTNIISDEFRHRCAHGIIDLEKLNQPVKSAAPGERKVLSIAGKYTDPNLLRLIKQSPDDALIEALVCPSTPELPPYADVLIHRTFAENRILHIQAPVTTLKMMHTQPDILVLQSQEIPPISILQLQ